jgi:hypothetical protein
MTYNAYITAAGRQSRFKFAMLMCMNTEDRISEQSSVRVKYVTSKLLDDVPVG